MKVETKNMKILGLDGASAKGVVTTQGLAENPEVSEVAGDAQFARQGHKIHETIKTTHVL